MFPVGPAAGQLDRCFPLFSSGLEQILSWNLKSTLHCMFPIQLSPKFSPKRSPPNAIKIVIMLPSQNTIQPPVLNFCLILHTLNIPFPVTLPSSLRLFLFYIDINLTLGHAVAHYKSLVRFPMVLMEFFIDIILPAALWPWS